MKTLRALAWLRWAVLTGFLCAVGAATAAPFVHPIRTQLVCEGAGGVTLVVLNDDGLPVTSASPHCPLCLPVAGPAPAPTAPLLAPELAATDPPISAPTSAIALSAAPPPGRGPPVFY